MGTQLLPFNIELLTLTADSVRFMKPVTSSDIFEGITKNFHPNGLFSTEIFGKVGTEDRNTRYSYISLNTNIFHPLIFRILIEMSSFHKGIMEGTTYAIWNSVANDFEKATPSNGYTGFSFYNKHFSKIIFKDNKSPIRAQKIKVIELSKKTNSNFLDKLLIMPAGLRDYTLDKYGRLSESEINLYYRKILNLTHLIIRSNGADTLYDTTRYQLQLEVLKVYEYLESLLKGKNKLIVGKWGKRSIYNSTRNVITAMINDTTELDSNRFIGMNQTSVGLFQFLKATLPLSIYYIKTGFMSRVMPSPNLDFYMVNKKTLKKEIVPYDAVMYDRWMTEDGINKTINMYGEIPLRHMVLETDTHYFGLIYKGSDKTYMLLQDIDELPKDLDRKNVYPITFTELLYITVCEWGYNIPCFITRYPITGIGSVYPSISYIKTTLKSEYREEIDIDGNKTGVRALEFPILGENFMNSVSPHPSHMGPMGGDYDGDVTI